PPCGAPAWPLLAAGCGTALQAVSQLAITSIDTTGRSHFENAIRTSPAYGAMVCHPGAASGPGPTGGQAGRGWPKAREPHCAGGSQSHELVSALAIERTEVNPTSCRFVCSKQSSEFTFPIGGWRRGSAKGGW